MKHSLCVILCTIISIGFAQKTFHASRVTITNVPNMIGSLSATIYYDSTRGLMQTDYDIGISEIYNFTDKVVYKKCSGVCNAESINYGDFGFYTPYPGETASGSIACDGITTGSAFSRPASGYQVSLIAFDTSGRVCKAQLANGQTFIFKSFGSSTGTYVTTGCPQKQCSQKLDIMLVMDESGSIDSSEWNTMKNFAIQFTNAFSIGENAARIGLVDFSDTAQVRFSYQNDEQSFRNTMNSLTRGYKGGNTWTSTALSTTYSAYQNYARKGDVKHITVVITDGFCTCNDNQLRNAAAPLKTDSVGYIFAVGVDGANVDELNLIASGSSGYATINGRTVQTSFFASDWSKLTSILDGLIAATCTEFVGNPCGSSCQGYCGCNSQCLCPDDCSAFANTCNDGVCSTNANGAGCYSTPKTNPCDDQNACTNEYCSGNQCIRSDVVCPDKPCFDKTCDTQKGCVYTAIVCKDDNPCTDEYCNTTMNACDYSKPRACQACQAYNLNQQTCSVGKSLCENWDCVQTSDSTAECQKISDVNCDDLNACTIDSCDTTTGKCLNIPRTDCTDSDMCTDNYCDPSIGCVAVEFNATLRCDDLNLCTIDYCNSSIGCVYENVTCNTTDPCKTSVCNPLYGCQLQFKNCAAEPGIRDRLGDCYAALCNDGSGLVANVSTDDLGCYLDLQPDAKVDGCGVCKGDGTTCGFPLTVAQVAGISAGVIGGIAAGAAAFVIAGAVGAKKGYDAYMRNKGNMSGAQANPFYNDSGRSGTSPLYEMSSK